MTRSCRGPAPPGRVRVGHGFTLVEVLVALFALAVLASLAWQGLSMLVGARDATARSLAATQRLNSVILQWEQDLQALVDTEVVPALQFDGRALRLTRRGRVAGDGVVLVVWSLEDGRWRRWAAPPLLTMGELQEAWLRSQQLASNDPAQVLLAEGVAGWQLYFHRGGSWSNAQSTGEQVALPPPGARLRVAPAASRPGTGGAPAREAPSRGSSTGAAGTPQPQTDDADPPTLEGQAASPAPTSPGPTTPGVATPSPAASSPAAGAPASVGEALPAAVRLSVELAGQRRLLRDIVLAPGGAP